MPDATGGRSSVTPDMLNLLRLMSMRSDVVDRNLISPPAPAVDQITEIELAAPSILDTLVEARAAVEAPVSSGAHITEIVESTLQPDELDDPDETGDLEALDALDPDGESAAELRVLEADEPATDEDVAQAAEGDEPPQAQAEAPASQDAFSGAAGASTDGDRAEEQASDAQVTSVDTADLDGAQPSETAIPAETAASEQRQDIQEGPGADFEALLAGARGPESKDRAQEADRDPAMGALQPASAAVRLRARNGPRPGAEFSGRSTLAGASGVYCLVDRFQLPIGTRMKVTLTGANEDDQVDVLDAVISRVRRAPGDAAEVQLVFDTPHPEVAEFVDQQLADKPGAFSFFGRRRGKH